MQSKYSKRLFSKFKSLSYKFLQPIFSLEGRTFLTLNCIFLLLFTTSVSLVSLFLRILLGKVLWDICAGTSNFLPQSATLSTLVSQIIAYIAAQCQTINSQVYQLMLQLSQLKVLLSLALMMAFTTLLSEHLNSLFVTWIGRALISVQFSGTS